VLRDAAAQARVNAERRSRQTPAKLVDAPAGIRLPSGITAERASDMENERRRLQDEAKVQELRTQAKVPKRYALADLDDVEAVPPVVRGRYMNAVATLRGLLDNPVTMALIGTRGPGKTHMACALVNAFCSTFRSARYLNAMDYFIELKATYGDRAKRDESQVERDYLRPALLVVDEVHERGDTDWETRMLTRLVNRRYEEEKATVLVCNLTPAEFEKRVGESIADRIAEGGGIIVCDWPSLRGGKSS
jgi:DNA replication protein DnaC